MIAYSIEGKPLENKAIDKLVGCSVLFISPDTYYTKRKCDKDYLAKIHERGWPYILAPDIIKNELIIKGALNPRYAVLEDDGQVIILGKKIIPLNQFHDVEGVMYSDIKWKTPPQVPVKRKFDTTGMDERTRCLLEMGTQDFKPMYVEWDADKKRWLYSVARQEKMDYAYPQMFITREGFLNWRTKPDLYTMKLRDGIDNKEDVRMICQFCASEIEQTKKLIELNGVADVTEYEEYRMQMSAMWLLAETCKNLYKAHKKIDKENLNAIIDSIRVSNIRGLDNNTLPQYMYMYLTDIVELV